MSRIYVLVFSLLFVVFMFSCSSEGFNTHETGLEYKIIVENQNEVIPQVGDILVLSLKYVNESDSVLFDTKEIQGAFRMKMSEPSHKGGCIEDAFAMMHVGDSAIFKIDAHNFYNDTRKTQAPDFLKEGEKLTFYIKLIKIFDYQEWKAEQEKVEIINEQEEMAILENYLRITSTDVEPTESGLYFVSETEGKGLQPQKGDMVELHYLGYFTDGSPFDNSYQRGKPFEFRLGANEVIPGWEEGVAMMKEGGKARLVIPSKLAYGDKEFSGIPPFSTLVFEIELLKVSRY